MILFSALLLAHLLYDFHWQGDFVANMKGERWFILVVHALTWTLLLRGALRFWRVRDVEGSAPVWEPPPDRQMEGGSSEDTGLVVGDLCGSGHPPYEHHNRRGIRQCSTGER